MLSTTIALGAKDMAQIVQNPTQIHILNQLDQDIITTLRRSLGQEARTVYDKVRRELEAQLKTEPQNQLDQFRVSIQNLIEISNLSPVSKEYFVQSAQNFSTAANNYAQILPLSHSPQNQELKTYNDSKERFTHILQTKQLPQDLDLLESFLTLLNQQLTCHVTQVTCDFEKLSLTVNQALTPKSQNLLVPGRLSSQNHPNGIAISINRVVFDSHQKSNLRVLGNSYVDTLEAHKDSSITFEDQDKFDLFKSKNPYFFNGLNLFFR